MASPARRPARSRDPDRPATRRDAPRNAGTDVCARGHSSFQPPARPGTRTSGRPSPQSQHIHPFAPDPDRTAGGSVPRSTSHVQSGRHFAAKRMMSPRWPHFSVRSSDLGAQTQDRLVTSRPRSIADLVDRASDAPRALHHAQPHLGSPTVSVLVNEGAEIRAARYRCRNVGAETVILHCPRTSSSPTLPSILPRSLRSTKTSFIDLESNGANSVKIDK